MKKAKIDHVVKRLIDVMLEVEKCDIWWLPSINSTPTFFQHDTTIAT